MQKQLPFIAAANITNTSLTSSFLAVPEGFALGFWNCLKLAAVFLQYSGVVAQRLIRRKHLTPLLCQITAAIKDKRA